MTDGEAQVGPQDGHAKLARDMQPTLGGHEGSGGGSAGELPYVAPLSYLRPVSHAPPAVGSGSGTRTVEGDNRPMTPVDREQIEGLVSKPPRA